jgi:hypothetical protein
MAKLLRPINHTLMDECLENLKNDTQREQFRIFIHFLILKNYYDGNLNIPATVEEGKKYLDVEVFIDFLNSKIFNSKTSTNIISKASTAGALTVSVYCVGKFPKRYRVNYCNPKNLVENYNYTFKYDKNKEKYENLFDHKINKITNSNDNARVQIEFIRQLKLDEALFYKEWNKLLKDKREINELGICYLNYSVILEYECLMFDTLNGFSYYDDFSGRYYNFFTNKKAAIRKCFFINGYKLACLDVKSSQLYFLTQLPNLNLSKFEVDKSLIQIDDEFKNEVLNGDIYKFFAGKLKLERDEAKDKVLSYMYGDNRLKNIAKIFQLYFPKTFDTLQYLKKIPIEDKKFRFTKVNKKRGFSIEKNNYLNYILQSVERDIFLSSLDGMSEYFSVHDSVYFQEGREDEFRNKILNHFAVNNLDAPRLCLE